MMREWMSYDPEWDKHLTGGVAWRDWGFGVRVTFYTWWRAAQLHIGPFWVRVQW